ncbi:MAG: hypothetical protein CW341_00625 [Bacteroidetes bacterium]|nr:hypothetical protein [Bacteroidota bacterium]
MHKKRGYRMTASFFNMLKNDYFFLAVAFFAGAFLAAGLAAAFLAGAFLSRRWCFFTNSSKTSFKVGVPISWSS